MAARKGKTRLLNPHNNEVNFGVCDVENKCLGCKNRKGCEQKKYAQCRCNECVFNFSVKKAMEVLVEEAVLPTYAARL